jgi:hypothetical protein
MVDGCVPVTEGGGDGFSFRDLRQMNGNQLHSYLFNSLVQADPNSPSTYKPGWDVTASSTDLSTLRPWL